MRTSVFGSRSWRKIRCQSKKWTKRLSVILMCQTHLINISWLVMLISFSVWSVRMWKLIRLSLKAVSAWPLEAGCTSQLICTVLFTCKCWELSLNKRLSLRHKACAVSLSLSLHSHCLLKAAYSAFRSVFSPSAHLLTPDPACFIHTAAVRTYT